MTFLRGEQETSLPLLAFLRENTAAPVLLLSICIPLSVPGRLFRSFRSALRARYRTHSSLYVNLLVR